MVWRRRTIQALAALAIAVAVAASSYRVGRAFERERIVKDGLTLALLEHGRGDILLRIDGICEPGLQAVGRVLPRNGRRPTGPGTAFTWTVGRPFDERPSRVTSPYECEPVRFPLLYEDRAIIYPLAPVR